MSEIVRLYRFRGVLGSMRAVSAAKLMDTLEISSATLKRHIAKYPVRLHLPIAVNHELGGYKFFPNRIEGRELIGDIMHFGTDVQVLAPAALQSKVQKEFLEAPARYV